jgi:alpha-N-arabinofuranosidase
MKKIITLALLALPLWAAAQTATIRIDTERIIDQIDPKIYGAFMEPIGRDTEHPITNNLYGPLYNPDSPKANADGFNQEYIDAIRELKITNLRWPGGNFMSSYNWQDGIGPKDQRPVRKDLAWHGFETNQVGTDEWVALSRALGVENVTCINLGLGDIQNAAYWVEYCNVPKGTYFSDLRVKNGNPEPFNIKYWDLGNEIDGFPWLNGAKNIEDYLKIALEAGKALKNVDPTIKLVACGSSWYESTGGWLEWNQKVINSFTGLADYLSVHRYWGDGFSTENYYDAMGDAALDFEEKIIVPKAMAQNALWIKQGATPMKLAFDEWGGRGIGIQGVMANAMCLNAFIRHADFVKMANLTMLTSLVQTDRETGNLYKSPQWYMWKLVSGNCRGASIDTFVQCDTFDATRFKDIPYLDVVTVLAEDGKTVYINVVNRHQDQAISARIENSSAQFTGSASATTITGELGKAYTYAERDSYEPKAERISVRNGEVSYSFPAHSFTQIALSIN